MKKFILGLFLILGAMSIAAPEYVDVKGMEKKGYIIYKNKKDSFVAFKITQNDRIGVTLYFSDKDNAEYLTNTFKRSAPSALIIEHIFKDLRVSFIYIILLQKNKK